MMGPRMFRVFAGRLPVAMLCGLLSAPVARAASFLPTLGWEDDVDVVVAPGGGFLVIPEESPAGAARLSIMELDTATGAPIAIHYAGAVPGFEVGVDPVVVPELAAGEGCVVLAPVESVGGATAAVLVLHTDTAGNVLASVSIMLGDLGFRKDVDFTWSRYAGPAIAYVPLESVDGTVRGVLAIDVDPRDITDPPGVGAATLLSTDGRGGPGIVRSVLVDWLPGLAEGVDPVSYEITHASRLALPVTGPVGSDLLLVDFDPNDPIAPLWTGHLSVKAINAGSARPTDFPGFERDVDMRLFLGECTFVAATMLVPVEGAGDVADLYLLDQNGVALRTFSVDGTPTGWPDIPGFEKGVDLVPLCNVGGAHPQRVAIPVENSAGTDADLWMLDLQTLQLLARAGDPARNPGLTLEGWEVGVDLVPWSASYLAAPAENRVGKGRMLSFDLDLILQDEYSLSALGGDWGFRESVDAVAADIATPPFRNLFAPVQRLDGSDATVLMFPAVPTLDVANLETINPGLAFGRFEWDVDLGLVRKQAPGGAFLYLPEEGSAGARLRFETVPSPPDELLLAAATERLSTLLPALRFFRASSGAQVLGLTDVLGLEYGLDMANGRGPITPSNPPQLDTEPGFDADSDPTPIWALSSVGELPPGDFTGGTGPGQATPGDLRATSPSLPPVEIRFALAAAGPVEVDVVDAAGRRVRHLADGARAAGEVVVSWDGRDGQGVPAAPGVYFVEVREARALRSSKIVLVR